MSEESIKAAIGDLFDGKPADFKEKIYSVLYSKAQDQIDIVKGTVASGWLNDEQETDNEEIQ